MLESLLAYLVGLAAVVAMMCGSMWLGLTVVGKLPGEWGRPNPRSRMIEAAQTGIVWLFHIVGPLLVVFAATALWWR